MACTNCRRWLGALGVAAGMGLIACLPAAGQPIVGRANRGNDGDAPALAGIFQPAPSDVRKPLQRAQKAIAERRYEDAARELGTLLMNDSPTDLENQDYFLFDNDEKRQEPTTLKTETRRLLASLPVAGREAYELQFGAQARALFDEALAGGDLDKLYDVTRRFPLTRAGCEAAMLAGRGELARGRPLAAALCFQQLSETPQAAALFDPELSILLATCWTCTSMPEKATAVLVSLQQRMPQATVRFGKQELKLFAANADPLAWLQNGIGRLERTGAPRLIEWVLFRGNAQRNAKTQGGIPLLNFRWRVPTPLERQDEKLIEQLAKRYRDEGRAAIPAVQPLAIGGTILMRTPEKLLGVDFRSGKRIWVWPPWDEAPPDRDLDAAHSARARFGLGGREQEVHQRIWEDAAYGQLSSDGQSVYLLHELGYASAGHAMHHAVLIGAGGLARVAPGAPRTHNLLVSLSLARQGAAQWVVGGEHGEDEPELAGAFFLGPPLPLAGKLYVLAEFNGEIRLVVLSARNGRLEWQQQLAHTDMQTILVDGTRRLAGATPSYAEGVLLCPTSAGALVAVNLGTRSLLWGHSYLRQPQLAQPNFGFAQFQARPPRPLGSRWVDATATVADGRVLLTAAESDELHAVDLLTGKPLWPPVKRDDLLYLACVHGDAAVFAGTAQVIAYRLSDGKPAWSKPLALTDPPSGRGFYSGNHYFLPTTKAELLTIDVDRGELVRRTSTSVVLGNLVCYRDDVISQGPDWLAAFSQAEPLRRQVDQLLAANPNDVRALAHRGELLLQAGQRDAALVALEKAHQLAPQEDTVRVTLVNALLDALREDFAAHRQDADKIERLLDRPQQRNEFLRLMAAGWQATGQIEKAFRAYQELARLKGQAPAGAASQPLDLEKIGRNWNVRLDRWLQARIGELLASADSPQRTALDREVRQQYEAALQSGDPAALQRFLAIFGAHPAAEAGRLKRATQWVDAGDWLSGELLLSRFEDRGDAATQAQAAAETARLLEATRQYERAAAYYRRLADRWPDLACRDGQTGRQLLEAARATAPIQAALGLAQAWPYGKITVSESTEQAERIPNFRRLFRCRVTQRTPATPHGLHVSYDQQRNALVVRDGWGQTLLNAALGAHKFTTPDFSLIQARANGHLLVVSVGHEILALNLLQASRNRAEAILWRQELVPGSPGPDMNILQANIPVQLLKHPWGGSRRVYADPQQRLSGALGPVCDTGVCFLSLRELICADPLTGETLWSRDGVPQGSDLFGDGELLFLVPPASDQAQVFSTLDGRELGVRKVDLLENRWATCGRKVLAWKQPNDTAPLELRVYDAWTGKDLWRESLPPGTKGDLIDSEEVAVLDPAGKFLVRSLQDDRPRLQVQVEPEKSLVSLHVLRSQTQYILATNRAFSADSRPQEVEFQAFNSSFTAPLLTGSIYAFDCVTGKPQWPVPATVESYGMPLDQPVESPLLVFMRNVRSAQPQSASRQQRTSLLCLDRRDGRSVLLKDDIPAQTFTFDVLADPQDRTVTVTLPAKAIALKLTDEPIPPEPPVQTSVGAAEKR